jgi:hypothetical protein
VDRGNSRSDACLICVLPYQHTRVDPARRQRSTQRAGISCGLRPLAPGATNRPISNLRVPLRGSSCIKHGVRRFGRGVMGMFERIAQLRPAAWSDIDAVLF